MFLELERKKNRHDDLVIGLKKINILKISRISGVILTVKTKRSVESLNN